MLNSLHAGLVYMFTVASGVLLCQLYKHGGTAGDAVKEVPVAYVQQKSHQLDNGLQINPEVCGVSD